MKVLAVNGSPRKNWNTGTLLQAALDRAAEAGCETEFVQLSSVPLRGCSSCLACKREAEPFRSDPLCAMKDGLRPVLERARAANVLLVGSPVYYGTLTAEAWAFLTRYWFAAFNYDPAQLSKIPANKPTGFIATMNVPDAGAYRALFDGVVGNLQALSGPVRTLMGEDTCQVDDYVRYRMLMFDAEHKAARRYSADSADVQRARTLMDELLGMAKAGE